MPLQRAPLTRVAAAVKERSVCCLGAARAGTSFRPMPATTRHTGFGYS